MKLRVTYLSHPAQSFTGHAPGAVLWDGTAKNGGLRRANGVDVVQDHRTTIRVHGGSTRQRKEAIKTLRRWIVARQRRKATQTMAQWFRDRSKDRLDRWQLLGRWSRDLRARTTSAGRATPAAGHK